jgi:hypothetical protein
MSGKSGWLDALNARQKHWEKGLPWSRFSISGIGFGVMLLLAALPFPEVLPLNILGGLLLLGIGLFSLFKERRVRAQREGVRR